MAASSQPAPTLYTPELIETRPPVFEVAYAIDPPGTIEVDDAIAVRFRPDSKQPVADVQVLIADTSFLISWPEVIIRASKRCYSRYRDGGRSNYMLPLAAIKQLSLNADSPVGAPALSVEFEVSEDHLVFHGWRQVRVNVQPMTYKEARKRYYKGDHQMKDIVQSANYVRRNLKIPKSGSHGVASNAVASHMVAANHLMTQCAAEQRTAFLSRSCFGEEPGSARALYSYGGEVKPHLALGLDYYGHWTSPIRRFPDMLNIFWATDTATIQDLGINPDWMIGTANRSSYRRPKPVGRAA